MDHDENGHKNLKEAKEETATIYDQFEGTLKKMAEEIKKIGDKKEEAPKTPQGRSTGGLNTPPI